jgi:tRNA(adenine34) deaminase
MSFWVYIVRCADQSYYTGHTDDLECRLSQHESGAIENCYTFKRRPVVLIYAQDFSSREEALSAEMQIKRWSRAKKEAFAERDWSRLRVLAKNHTEFGQTAAPSIHGSTGSPRTVSSLTSEERVDTDKSNERWMRRALALADRAEREDDEIPVGAVLIGADGTLLGEGWNRNITDHDPTAHAEIVAMRQGGKLIGNHRLVGSTLYVTLEPCAMCAMAMVHARIARLVFAASDPKTGAAGSVFDLLADPRHNHRVAVQGGVMTAEASTRLTAYFRRKRGKSID